ncbi:hypothetical protein [Haploplasma axanthum]|nr:hypothetical protein [Haploplasma axanthum]
MEKSYVKNEIIPLKNENFDEYLKKVSIFADFAYQTNPVLSETLIDENGTIGFDLYRARKYYKNDKYIDGIILFLNTARYKNNDFISLDSSIIYNEVVNTSSDSNSNNINLESITQKTFFPAFFINNYTLENNKISTIKEIRINITTKNFESKPLLSFSSNESTVYLFNKNLDDYPFTHSSYSLDEYIQNIRPTDSESNINNLHYLESNRSIFKNYTYILIIWYSLYGLLIIILSYLILFKPLIKFYKEKNSK